MRKSSGKRASTTLEGAAGFAPSVLRPAPPALTFAAMTLEDVPDVAALECRVFPDPWSVDSFLAEVDRRPDVGWPVVARDVAGELAAYAVVWFIVDEVHIGNIAVRPELQGRGAGSLLLRHVMDEGRRRRFHFATLEVRPSNTPALRLYERYGFRRVAVRARYYRNNGEDAYVLAAPLAAAPLQAGAATECRA
ncbi:ribosomal protein S18-alanine N-acetyltransferase [bacterium]|nr:ribosomal protein S18-alanine N-acetyltransferase [bacterium]